MDESRGEYVVDPELRVANENLYRLAQKAVDADDRIRSLTNDYDILAATNRALTEALDSLAVAHHATICHAAHSWGECNEAGYIRPSLDQPRALLSGQPVQARDEEHGALEAMAADVRSLSTQLGQKIEQAVERDGELERLREALRKAEHGMDMLNGDWGSKDRPCCFCRAREYDGRSGVLHTTGCPILEARALLPEARDE